MFFPGGSYKNFWSVINEYQLYQTLMLLGVYIPETLIKFWTDLKFSTFTFGELSALYIPNPAGMLIDSLDFEQEKRMFSRVGMESGSLLVNESFLISMVLTVLFLDIILTPCLYLVRRYKHTGRLRKVADKLLNYFHFQVYIRF